MTIEQLFSRRHILFDGGTGTEYQKRGLPVGAAPEEWIFANPDAVKDVHRAYVAAGSDVIETCTFGATRDRMKLAGIQSSVADLNKRAVELAREAADGKALVAGSVGPLGGILEPYGDLAIDDAEKMFAEQMNALVEAKVDIVLIETMLSLNEALVAVRAAKNAGAKIIGVTMTFEPTPDGPKTSFGESVRDVVTALESESISFFGSNCGSGFELMRVVANEFRAATKSPLLIQTNAGLPFMENGNNRYPEAPQSFGGFAKELADLGIQMIGGCCGTTPDHIAAAGNNIKQ
jgi:5-methyltetrahydrofolate--homocysteine methyltransferase